MFIHFDLPCESDIQQKLFKTFRLGIREWQDEGLVIRAVLTYHFPHGSLYLCLDIPSVKEPSIQKVNLTSEETKQIPKPIIHSINRICEENNVEPKIMDYRLEIEQAKKLNEEKGEKYYDEAPIEEILRFASIGTKIALNIFYILNDNKEWWNSDTELASFILSQLKEELGMDYKWGNWALHFVCNPLLIPEYSILYPIGNRALKAILAGL